MKLLTPLSLFSSHWLSLKMFWYSGEESREENISKPEPSGFEMMTWSSSDKYDYADLWVSYLYNALNGLV